jgi:hypothetical protein
MVQIDLDTEEWCEKCGKTTFHVAEHERLTGSGTFLYKLRHVLFEMRPCEPRNSIQVAD